MAATALSAAPRPGTAETTWEAFKAALLAFRTAPTIPNGDAVLETQAAFLTAYGLTQEERERQAFVLNVKMVALIAAAEFAETSPTPAPGQAVH